jgi:hypothetical protein
MTPFSWTASTAAVSCEAMRNDVDILQTTLSGNVTWTRMCVVEENRSPGADARPGSDTDRGNGIGIVKLTRMAAHEEALSPRRRVRRSLANLVM